MVRERWCVTKLCVKDGVSMMLCDEVPHCQHSATNATPATQSGVAPRATQHAQGRSKCNVKVDVTKFHACHAKRRWMSPSSTPATQNEGGCHQAPRLPCKVARARATQRAQARHQSQPSAPSATPATRNKGGCHQVSRLPRETKVDVTKCHACHAKLVCDKLGV